MFGPMKTALPQYRIKSAKHYPRWGAVHLDGCSTQMDVAPWTGDISRLCVGMVKDGYLRVG